MIKSYYQVGGSLATYIPSYVERTADKELYEALIKREFCYILNCRQMGKSSLLVRTTHRLQDQGFLCATVDLTIMGSENVTPEQWYKGIVAELCRCLDLFGKFNLKAWWQENAELSLVQRLSYFIEDVLLEAYPDRNIIILIDEIDSILSLKFKADDLFALIRLFYNKRANHLKYYRITWAICGVATPSDLILDRNRTPFNIGKAIHLSGFTVNEAQPLGLGLNDQCENGTEILKQILKWTSGQPFLTHKICQLFFKLITLNSPSKLTIKPGEETIIVESIIRKYVIEAWERQDEPEHLRTIRDRLLRNEQKAGRLLGIYQQILKGTEVYIDESQEQIELILSGLVIPHRNVLKVKNLIYQEVFNLEWVEQELNKLRPYWQLLEDWVASEQTDQSRLLRGKALEDAQTWAQDKTLSPLDYQFLAASEAIDRQEVQQTLETQRLKEVEKNATRQRLLIVVLIVAFITVTGLGLMNFWQYRKAIISERKARISEIQALTSSSEGLFASNRRLNALMEALRARKKLLLLGQVDPEIKTKVELALQQAILGIDEYNRLSKPGAGNRGLVFSPDGQIIIASGQNNTINIWTKQGQLLKTFKGQIGIMGDLAISQDGQLVASGSGDRLIKLWQPDGTLLRVLKGHQAAVQTVEISPNGQLIASGSEDGTVRLWRRDGTLLRTLMVGNRVNYGLTFTSDSQKILTSSEDGKLRVWQIDGQPLATVTGHQEMIMSIAINLQGDTLATASVDGILKLWKLVGNNLIPLTTLKAHKSIIWDLAFSPDGTKLASTSDDKTIKVWERLGSTWNHFQLQNTFAGYQGLLFSVKFSPDGQTLASISSDSTVKFWNLENRLLKPLKGHQTGVLGVAFSPDSKTLASASLDRTVKLWEINDRIKLVVPVGTLKTNQALMGVSFSPDGQRLAVSSVNGSVQLWTKDGQLLATLQRHQGGVRRSQFNWDGTRLVTGSGDGTIGLWNVGRKTPILLTQFKGHQAGVWVTTFSPDGEMIASSSGDGTIKFWTKDGQLLRTIQAHHMATRSIAYSSDGQFLVSGSDDQTIKLWKPDGTLVKTLRGHHEIVRSVAISPDGQLIASGSGDGVVQLWQQDGTLLTTLKAHNGGIWELAFSPDGQKLASASDDSTTILWNLQQVRSLDHLIAQGCNSVRDYLQTNGDLEESDRQLCDDVTSEGN